ncbi:MAG: hypothetical protein ACSLEY_04060 [Candidatus Saccharimonadales bacterium]
MLNRLGVRRGYRGRGFTIIELMLAMSFVSVLLIAVAILSMNLSRIYARGIMYKELNQTGSEIVDDIERTARSSNVTDIKYINTNEFNRLCLGRYSYVWNEITDSAPGSSRTNTTVSGATSPIRLMKVADSTQSYCVNPEGTDTVPSTDNTQLLGVEGNRELHVYNISMTPLVDADGDTATPMLSAAPEALNANKGLYTLRITLGTGDITQIDLTADPQCRPPSADIDTDLTTSAGDEYCAINIFTTVVLIGNLYTREGN